MAKYDKLKHEIEISAKLSNFDWDSKSAKSKLKKNLLAIRGEEGQEWQEDYNIWSNKGPNPRANWGNVQRHDEVEKFKRRQSINTQVYGSGGVADRGKFFDAWNSGSFNLNPKNAGEFKKIIKETKDHVKELREEYERIEKSISKAKAGTEEMARLQVRKTELGGEIAGQNALAGNMQGLAMRRGALAGLFGMAGGTAGLASVARALGTLSGDKASREGGLAYEIQRSGLAFRQGSLGEQMIRTQYASDINSAGASNRLGSQVSSGILGAGMGGAAGAGLAALLVGATGGAALPFVLAGAAAGGVGNYLWGDYSGRYDAAEQQGRAKMVQGRMGLKASQIDLLESVKQYVSVDPETARSVFADTETISGLQAYVDGSKMGSNLGYLKQERASLAARTVGSIGEHAANTEGGGMFMRYSGLGYNPGQAARNLQFSGSPLTQLRDIYSWGFGEDINVSRQFAGDFAGAYSGFRNALSGGFAQVGGSSATDFFLAHLQATRSPEGANGADIARSQAAVKGFGRLAGAPGGISGFVALQTLREQLPGLSDAELVDFQKQLQTGGLNIDRLSAVTGGFPEAARAKANNIRQSYFKNLVGKIPGLDPRVSRMIQTNLELGRDGLTGLTEREANSATSQISLFTPGMGGAEIQELLKTGATSPNVSIDSTTGLYQSLPEGKQRQMQQANEEVNKVASEDNNVIASIDFYMSQGIKEFGQEVSKMKENGQMLSVTLQELEQTIGDIVFEMQKKYKELDIPTDFSGVQTENKN